MTASRFAKLLDLAKAPSSEKRRELLREVTDLFFDTADVRTSRENALFDDVLRHVAREMEQGVLAELSVRFADSPDAPQQLMRDLAANVFSVAEPVLKRSPVLKDETLVEIVQAQSQDHIRAIAQRETVSPAVSDVISRVGDDAALNTLLRNAGAKFARATMEHVVDRAKETKGLHESVVGRADLPLDLMNEMYFVVEQRLRSAIMSRNAKVDPQELDAALMKARARMQSQANLDHSEDIKAAIAAVDRMMRKGELRPQMLVAMHRENKQSQFLVGLARLTDVDIDTCRGVLSRQDMDALAMLCRAANFDRPLFVTIAVLCCGGQNAMKRAEEFGKLYASVPVEAAQRAVRFFKVRRNADEMAA
jgi:uncharacterized protein (DUF2336 family)